MLDGDLKYQKGGTMGYKAVYAKRNDNGDIETFGLSISGNTNKERTREAKLKAIQYDWRFMEIRLEA